MKSTPKTRKESIDKIQTFISDNILSSEERESLQNVLGVLEDATEYARFMQDIDLQVGLSRIHDIVVISDDHWAIEILINAIFKVSETVSGKNIY